jgi:chloramphenicol 3-O phosphotransferase
MVRTERSDDARAAQPAGLRPPVRSDFVFGTVVVLSGPSRAGKSTIAARIQDTLDGIWMHIGMDLHIQATPPRYRPGVGLRPVRPEDVRDVDGRVPYTELVDAVPALYAGLYGSAAAHARNGLNVVMDIYHHDNYSRPLATLDIAKRELSGLPNLFVGVNAPLDVIWDRRGHTWGQHRESAGEDVRRAVELHDTAAHALTYDIELDTSELSPDECVDRIRRQLNEAPGTALTS